MSEVVTRTVIKQNQVYTPLLVANEAKIDKFSLSNLDNIQAKNGFIESLTIKELTVLNEEIEGDEDSSETYENATFNEVILKFNDSDNCKYTFADANTLTSEEGGLMLNFNMEVPSELGAKLVCRYLVLDFRNISENTVIGVTWPEFPIRWLYGVPDIQAGYFYVLAFQRFAKDLIVGNVAVKIEG